MDGVFSYEWYMAAGRRLFMDKKVTEVVEAFAQPIVEELNLELVDVEYVKEGQDWFLRVFIDSEKGVDIEECGAVSERLSEALDKEDPIPHLYFLDVSSPGAERPLKKEKDFQQAVGNKWQLKHMSRLMVKRCLKEKCFPTMVLQLHYY